MNAPLRFLSRQAPELDLLARLEESEWQEAPKLERAQRRRLDEILKHARDTVPFYRDAPATFEALPIVTRRDLQDHAPALLSDRVPARVGRQFTKRSSGSTGEPVAVVRTDLEQV